MEIGKGLWISGEVPRINDFEKGDKNLYAIHDGGQVPDPLRDDMSLFAGTDKGLLVILGCAHSGIMNIIEHGKKISGMDRVFGIVGGTHLGLLGDSQREKTLEYLEMLEPDFIAPSHCTGLEVMSRLKVLYGKKMSFASVGASFEFE